MAERRRGRNTDKGKSVSGKDRSTDRTDNQKMEVMEVHSYARCSSPELTPVPGSEPCTPDPKKSKPEPTLSEVQNNIVQILAEKMNQNTETLHQEIKQNRECINSLKEATEYLFKEMHDVKKDIVTLKESNEEHQKRISELEERVNEAERYQRRWNLRLYGLIEQEGENVKQRVIDICRAVVPESGDNFAHHIDVVHRVGRKSAEKVRPIILRFTARSAKELLWKSSKGSEYLQSRKLRFGEDLTTKDKDTRNRLWPQIEAARKQGKKAFFVGAKAIIDGKEIRG